MIAVADASPVCYLILIGNIDLDLVLLDDKAARRAAEELGLRVTGLLGLLVEAASRGLIDLPASIERLTKTSFRCAPVLMRSVLADFRR